LELTFGLFLIKSTEWCTPIFGFFPPTTMPSTSKALSLPRWVDTLRSTLTKNLKENKDLISYAFASIDRESNYPKVRYVVHRGFVNERRKDGDGSNNLVKDEEDKDLISDKLVVTTDARSVNYCILSRM